MQNKNSLGPTIKALRKMAGLTQAQLAARAALERTSITNIERGNQIVTERTLNAIADAMGYTVHVTFRKK